MPEAIQPETTLPAKTRPDTTQPDITRPDTTQPDTTQPDTAQPRARLGGQEIWDLAPGESVSVRDRVTCGEPKFSSAFKVNEVTKTSISLAALAISEFGRQRGLAQSAIHIDGSLAAARFTNHIEIDGVAPPLWADLSGYYETGDSRHIQFHCNFPHHAAGVIELLGGDSDRSAIEAEVRKWNAEELEHELISRGMIAAKLRTMGEWSVHPHALATSTLPLIEFEQIGEAPPRTDTTLLPGSQRDSVAAARMATARKAATRTAAGGAPSAERALSGLTSVEPALSGDGALSGIRVLDCSRVLAGPVAGQTLAGHGADVLRVSSPTLPSVEICVQLTGAGKRNASVDLDQASGRQTMQHLLSDADVWIDAFRPGALAGKGFDVEQVAEQNPGIVAIQLSAFDWDGPWAGRRGFDSIVQSTTGIVHAGSQAGSASSPLSLPVQALDYATGQLGAFAAARALQHQRTHGGSWRVRLSLLRTRDWLVGLGGPEAFTPERAVAQPSALYEVDSDWGRLRLAKPPTGVWTSAPRPLATAAAHWLPR